MLRQNYSDYLLEAGCDEAGRGCLAGPVFASAVILPKDFSDDLLDDSKKLTEKQRNYLRNIIEEKALYWAVSSIDNNIIDEINILNASILAMHNSLEKLNKEPEFIIIDGNRFKKFRTVPHKCLVKGDSMYMSIAAASVLAKTYRDEYMRNLHEQFPDYKWNDNKGYPTADHKQAIARYGITCHHRRSFRLNEQMKFKF